MKFLRLSVFAAAALFAAAAPAAAQSIDGERAGIARTKLISANPIGLLFEWYNGEFEYAFSSTASVAVAASTFDFWDNNERYTALDGIARYYPQGRALRGLSVGASLGIVSSTIATCASPARTGRHLLTLGIRGIMSGSSP